MYCELCCLTPISFEAGLWSPPDKKKMLLSIYCWETSTRYLELFQNSEGSNTASIIN
jgi:hypothetical protein